jgi:hypothetical protein
MCLMLIPIIHVNLCQIVIPDDQQVLRIPLLGILGKVKTACNHRFLVDDHYLVMCDSVLVIYIGLNARIGKEGG